jgi:hypothetical protein
MNWGELLNPWEALRREKLAVVTLSREQALLVEELRKAQKNDNRGPDGKFKKGGSK